MYIPETSLFSSHSFRIRKVSSCSSWKAMQLSELSLRIPKKTALGRVMGEDSRRIWSNFGVLVVPLQR